VATPNVGLTEALRDRYLLERELGAGGMATVYLAQDIRHHRRVALKVLRPELAAVIGAKRFLHEIETTANLQHPHILPLHDSGEVGGTAFYVMPHVEGESLRDRLTREKQLPIDVAVRIATEVASALDYAHRKKVIHRDIKPENILLHDGQALVADFGIALAASAAGGTRITETGLSLGTPHYMSPEQAMGEREITGRSDVYALGVVLYEMLTGDPPFTGSTAQAIVAQVVTETPRPLTPQRHTIPPHIEAAVLTALEKLPADRFASAAEFAQALAAPGARTVVTAPRLAPHRSRERLAWATAGVLALLLLGMAAYQLTTPRRSPRPLSASLLPPASCAFAALTRSNLVQLSPDGRSLAFIAVCGEEQSIWTRSLETGESRRLAGTSGAAYPFWAPDGRSLGFFAAERLKRLDLESGAVRDLASAPDGRGGSWAPSGSILFAPDLRGPIHVVPADGGEPQPATFPPAGARDESHRLPYFLPDGRHFLFSRDVGRGIAGELLVGELNSRETRKLNDTPSNVAYAQGYLLYARDGVLLAQPFDPDAAKLSGTAVAIAPSIEFQPFRHLANYAASPGGRLVFREAELPENRIDWFDPTTGTSVPLLDRGPYTLIRLSPDGRRLLVARLESRGPLLNVWLYELDQGAWSRLSSEPKLQSWFAWSFDGRRVILESTSDSTMQILSLEGGDLETVRRLLGDYPIVDWAPDGSYAVGVRQVRETGWDLTRWSGRMDSSSSAVLYSTPADEMVPRISPDGRYVAYLSDQTGRFEVYLARLPAAVGHVQVSVAGTEFSLGPLAWSRNGRALYFLGTGGTLHSISVATQPVLHIGKPAPVRGAPKEIRAIEAAPDGRLLLLYSDRPADTPLTLVENWTARLETR
jgi:serine/threonine protein kinase/Tol biopolymer transport system component